MFYLHQTYKCFLHNIKQLKNVPIIKNNKIRMDEYNYYFNELIIIPTFFKPNLTWFKWILGGFLQRGLLVDKIMICK